MARSVIADTMPLSGIMAGFAASAQAMGLDYDEALGRMRQAGRGLVADTELMRQANVALTGAGAELAVEFGEHLPALLKIARASARATGKDTTFLFESLVTGVKRSSPLLIDNTGLQIKLGDANAKLAAELGKSVEALTAEERQIALLRATIEAGLPLVEQMGDIPETSAEKWQRWQTQLRDMRDEIGLRLQPVISGIIDRLLDLGGRVLPELSDAFSGIVGIAGQVVTAIWDEFAPLIPQATGWGQSFAQSFADGVATALPYLLGVIRGVRQIIEYWFGPGSPPRIAPDIDEWGQAALQEFYDGMKRARIDRRVIAEQMKAAQEAQFRYRLATASTTEQIELWREKLDETAKGSAEYWNILTTIAQLEKSVAGEADTAGGIMESAASAASRQASEAAEAIGAIADGIAQVQRQAAAFEMPDLDIDFDIEAISRRADEVAAAISGPITGRVESNLGRGLAERLGLQVSADEQYLWRQIGAEIVKKIGEGALALSVRFADVAESFRIWTERNEAQDALRRLGRNAADFVIGGINALFSDEDQGNRLIAALCRNLGRAMVNLRQAIFNIGYGIGEGIGQAIYAAITGEEAPEELLEEARERIEAAVRAALALSSMTPSAALTGNIPGYAQGTLAHPGGWSVVGEHGPELVYVPRGAQILPAPATVSITMYNQITNDVDIETMAYRVAQVIRRRTR